MLNLKSKIIAAVLTFFVLVGIVSVAGAIFIGFTFKSEPSKCDVLLKERHNLYMSDVVSDDTKAMLLPHLDSAINCNCK